jgi:hypothetical protein
MGYVPNGGKGVRHASADSFDTLVDHRAGDAEIQVAIAPPLGHFDERNDERGP